MVTVTGRGAPLAAPRGLDEQRFAGKQPIDVAREFEVILAAQMIGAMRKTVPSGGLLATSAAHRVLDGAFDHEVARSLVARANFGIAQQLAAQMARRAPHAAPSVVPAGAAPASAAIAARPSAAPTRTAAHPVGMVRASEPGTPSRPVEAPTVPQTLAPAAPALRFPVDGRITSHFGSRRNPVTGVREFHGGVDLAAPRGSEVRAAAGGEVVFSGRRGAGGNVIEVRHADGLVTSYAHVERRLVRNGQKVAAGDVLATVGSTGRATGPHLHFSVRRGGQVLDPARILEHAAGDGTDGERLVTRAAGG
jgi:murein DD-endopeptidase MepM/ murein hydrolase activator NlpD